MAAEDAPFVDLAAERSERWKDGLKRTKAGFVGNEFNIAHALRSAPLFFKKISWDERRLSPAQTGDTPAGPAGAWTDAYTARATIWLQSEGIPAKPKAVDTSLLAVAHENIIDPLGEWLRNLEWDGQERIGTWLAQYCQAEENTTNSIIGSKFLIGAAARALRPGCRMDNMLVLEGVQGAKKSTAIKVLGGDYVSENLPDFHGKDSMLIMARHWLIEVSEMSATKKSEIEQIKAFISRTVDTFRHPYGRHMMDVPRRSVLIGNLNPDGNGYLQDVTGNRRFWPVRVGQIDIPGLQRDRDQLWAEAVHCLNRGDPWWIASLEENEQVSTAQADRAMEEPWVHSIDEWSASKIGTFTLPDLAFGALNIERKDLNRATSIRIGITLKKLGFDRRRIREGNDLSWEYFKPE